jgi:hypothetical protein
MADRGTCKSCGAAILWVVTASGKRMPLDANAERRFVIEPEEPPLALSRETYSSHFATCPNAAQHRKDRP